MQSGRQRLRGWIERSKVKDYEAADLLDVDKVTLSQWLSGVKKPGLANAVKIEQVTGISVESWLLTSVSPPADGTETDADNGLISKR